MPRPTISLQAAIGPGSSVSNLFIIGVSVIGGTDVIGGVEIVGQGTWAELADRCLQVSTRRGRARLFEQFRAGTLTATFDNSDGALDPTWTAGPYTDGGVSRIRPPAGVWLAATYAGVTYDLYTGYSDSWRPTYRYPEGGLVDVAATDAFKIFARINPLAQTAVGVDDTTGARVSRILDAADWSTQLRDIEAGSSTHQATTLDGPIATQLHITADSERGDLYVNPSGKVTMRGRLARYTSPYSRIAQWQIGDGPTDLHMAEFEPAVDDDLVYNDVNVSRVGGLTVTRTDPTITATQSYLLVSYNRSDLTLADDGQVASYADDVLRIAKDLDEPRIDSITFEPDGFDDLWPMLLGTRFGDRVDVSVTHPFTGVVFEGPYFVEGVDHDIPVLESGGRWRTTFHLADASGFPSNPFIIGVSLIGGTDVII